MSALKRRVYKALQHFFWRTICCRPDGEPLHSWWYHHTGNIARFFHRRSCNYCLTGKYDKPTSKEHRGGGV